MIPSKRGIARMMAGLALVLCLTGCGDGSTGPEGPTPGTLTVTLTTPNADDGAILLTVSGPDMTQVTAADGSLYFRHAGGTGAVTAVLVGDVQAGSLLTFHVPDVTAAGSYSATITQVADRSNTVRASLAGYALTVE
jgi:hypothetical protein